MKAVATVLLFAAVLPAQQAWHATSFPVANLTGWHVNGGPPPGGYLTSPAYNGISMLRADGPTTDQEVRGTFRMGAGGGGLILYARATSNARVTVGGTFYAMELGMISGGAAGCLMNLTMFRSVNGSLASLGAATNLPCYDGMQWRFIVRGNVLMARHDPWRGNTMEVTDNSIASGLAGVGVRGSAAANGISEAIFYYIETQPPATASGVSGAAFGNRVDLQWHGIQDPAPSAGIHLYQVERWRNGVREIVAQPWSPNYSDPTVQPSTAYQYHIYAVDAHRNWSPVKIVAVTTPAAGTREPWRVGLRPEGTYWGGAGEQIDMQSGNVNLTVPLVTAKARGGMQVNLALSYNSQLWRKDGSTVWSFGRDVGYGYGWRLLAGSITPVFKGWGQLNHFVYTDSSGAEYRLDRNSGGTWTGSEGVMVAYEESTNYLRFPDGTWWHMDSASAQGEPDAGTRYPVLMQDTNGNKIIIDYAAGASSASGNTSARIARIWDGQSPLHWTGTAPTAPTWNFGWDASGHLQFVSGPSWTSRTLTYSGVENVLSPFAGDAFAYAAAKRLTSVTTTGGKKYQFEYGSTLAGTTTGELTRYTLPFGGSIRWEQRNFTYAGARTAREIWVRYLQAVPGGGETRHIWARDDANDVNRDHHGWTTMWQDTPAGEPASGDRAWYFDTGGKLVKYQERAPGFLVRRQTDLVWTWIDVANQRHPYVQQTTQTSNEGGASITTVSTQQLDAYGNVTTAAKTHGGKTRTTTISYLHQAGPNAAEYDSRYIRNRVRTVTVTDGTETFVPFTAQYDTTPLGSYDLPSGLALRDPAFGSGAIYRGNATVVSKGAATTTVKVDIAGLVRETDGAGGAVTVRTSMATLHSQPSWMSLNGVGTTLNYDGYQRLSAAVGAAGDVTGFGWDEDGDPVSRTLPDGTSVKIDRNYTTRLIKEIVRNHRWTKKYVDGLGRTVKEEAGYGGVPLPNGQPPKPEVTETVVETQYVPCACGRLAS